MKNVEAPMSARRRVLDFIDAYRRAADDADIEIMLGMDEDRRPALLVNVAGSNHCLLATEARMVANIMEGAMNACPNDPASRGLPNIIMALRAACDKADRGYAADT